ncbi:MAG TPA: tetratricopeptide repeat protein, partial [Acidimicrobiales bacterium]|nr:tetratricopeptide repeat protein [Acidimicrobiales bacterium]
MIGEPPMGEVAAVETIAETIGTIEMAEPGGSAPEATYLGQPEAPGAAGEEHGEAAGEGGEGEGKEAKEGKKPPARPSARILTITVVLATLVAALGGFLLNRASAASANASDVAQQLSLRGAAAQSSLLQQAESDYSQYLQLESLKAQAAQEMLEATYDQPGTQAWADLYATTSAQSEQSAALLPADLKPNLSDGDPDPAFPADFFAQRIMPANYLLALADGYNDVSGKWSHLVDSYTAILTMLAVSLFLFGSAFVLYGRNRLLFSILGGLLVATGVAWGASVSTTGAPGSPSPGAATDYADGQTTLADASAPGAYQTAIDDFSAAIKLRPDDALAYSLRGAAEALRGSEEEGAGFVTVVQPYWEKRAAADEQTAFNLGDHEPSQYLNVGWSYYTLWLSEGGHGRAPEQAVTFFKEAARLDPSYATDWLDLGVAQLAAGDYQGARSAFIAGVTHMLYQCSAASELSTCTTAQPNTAQGLQAAWLGAGIQALEDLTLSAEGQASPRLRSEAAALEGMLSDSMDWGQVIANGPYGDGLVFPKLEGALLPGATELFVAKPASVTQETFAHAPLTVVWFERPYGQPYWIAVTSATCWGNGHELCGGFNTKGNFYYFSSLFLASEETCFSNYQYKVEVWAAGKLAGSEVLNSQSDWVHSTLTPALSRGMDMGLCVPSSWHTQSLPSMKLPVYGTRQTVTGPLKGAELHYASSDGSQGVYVFRLYPPRTTPAGAQVAAPQLVQSGVNYALSLVR